MKPYAPEKSRYDERVASLSAAGEPYAEVIVVRTQDSTSTKAGARALVSAQGDILEGWVGGGCARGAIRRAVARAIDQEQPQFVALRPEDSLAAQGVEARTLRDGCFYERNGCLSGGSMDIFVDPKLPIPALTILGDGPVARALRRLAGAFDYRLLDGLPSAGQSGDTAVAKNMHYVVVATQGKGDAAALEAAARLEPRYLAFVGSQRKAAALKERLVQTGLQESMLEHLRAPAGHAIGAATAEEIALSILAEVTSVRRTGAKG